MTDTPPFRVYSDPDRRYARCVEHPGPAEQTCIADGWSFEFDWPGDRVSGWTKAAVEHGLFPEDYDDRMTPIAQSEPLVLYRSVSVAELHDIMATGSVMGGGNGFNGFDRRPFVFFSPEVTERVIWQGEELDRAAAHAAMKGIDGALPYPEAREQFLAAYPVQKEALRARLAEASFTSALLRTHPISGGMHYSEEHGSSGMGEEDEFGYLPGVVRLDDIETVTLVRRMEIGETYSVAELRSHLAQDGDALRFPR